MSVLIQREFVVDVPLERAWNHLAQIEAWPSWAKHIKSVTIEPPGNLSPSAVGVLRLANPLRSGWPGMKARFAMTEFAPKSRWTWVGKFLWLTVHYDHRFEPINESQTKIQFIIEARGFGASVIRKPFAAVYSKNLDQAIPNLIAEMNAELRAVQ
jgi:hypothetical protein